MRGEFVFAGKAGSGVTGVHGPVAIGVAGFPAGRATFGIGFADHDGQVLELREGGDDGERIVHVLELVAHAHANVVVREGGRTLGVEGDKVKRGAGTAGDIVGALGAVQQECVQELAARTAGGFRPTHAGGGKGATNAVHGVVIEFAVVGDGAMPVADVRFVPDFPIPAGDFGGTILLHAVFGPLIGKFTPLRIVFGRIGLPGVVGGHFVNRRMVWIILGMGAEGFGHETDLDVGFETALKVSIEDAVIDGPVVDGMTGGVFLVGAGGTPFEGVGTVAAGEQVVAADVNLRTAELAEFGEQLPAVFQVSIIGLVIAEKTPNRSQLAHGPVGMDLDGNGESGGIGAGNELRNRGHEQSQEEPMGLHAAG